MRKYCFYVLGAVLLAGCFMDLENTMLKNEQMYKERKISAPSKVFLKDASVITMPKGFTVADNKLKGRGARYDVTGKISNSGADEAVEITLDSVSAISYYTPTRTSTGEAADVLFGVSVFANIVIGSVAIYCAVCPKCCFGSCPTVYSFDGDKYNLEAELFSHAIAKTLEDGDSDVLLEKCPADGRLRLMITNEALETHYINRFKLLDVKHPEGTRVFPSPSGGLIAVRTLSEPESSVNINNEDIISLISRDGGGYYRSGDGMVRELDKRFFEDEVVLRFKAPQGCTSGKLVIKYRNTLLSTVLFYDMVLGSQGVKAMDWIDRMNSDPFYAAQFKLMYRSFSGIDIGVRGEGGWKNAGSFPDAGPINWKWAAAEIPVYTDGYSEVKLSFFPDNYMIDYIACEFGGEEIPLAVSEFVPYEVRNSDGLAVNYFNGPVSADDEKYLVTNPGEKYELFYRVDASDAYRHSFIISSSGYYNEWLRGSWIRNNDAAYEFDLYDIRRNVTELSHRWLADRSMMEQEFFRTRIPVKGGMK